MDKKKNGCLNTFQLNAPDLSCTYKRRSQKKQVFDQQATKNAAPKGRINSEWIAELFLQMLMIIITSSIAAGLIAELCWLAPAWPVLPDSKPAPCSVQLTQPQYPHH